MAGECEDVMGAEMAGDNREDMILRLLREYRKDFDDLKKRSGSPRRIA